jgi:hypothetical protein
VAVVAVAVVAAVVVAVAVVAAAEVAAAVVAVAVAEVAAAAVATKPSPLVATVTSWALVATAVWVSASPPQQRQVRWEP